MRVAFDVNQVTRFNLLFFGVCGFCGLWDWATGRDQTIRLVERQCGPLAVETGDAGRGSHSR